MSQTALELKYMWPQLAYPVVIGDWNSGPLVGAASTVTLNEPMNHLSSLGSVSKRSFVTDYYRYLSLVQEITAFFVCLSQNHFWGLAELGLGQESGPPLLLTLSNPT